MARPRGEINKRDNSNFEITIVDEDGNAINLTDGTVFFTVKKKPTDTDEEAIIKKDITAFDDPTSGVCLLNLTPEDTNISPGVYWFDIQFKDATDGITSSSAGKFLVRQDITIRTTLDNELS